MKIVIINGRGGSGKDTIVKYVQQLLNEQLKITNISSIDVVKEAARILGWENVKDEKSRKFLSDMKRLSIEYNNFPFRDIVDKVYKQYISSKITDDKHMVFIHIREPNEIQKILNTLKRDENFQVYTLLIQRIDENLGNYSDDNVDNFKYDCIINNYSDFSVTEYFIKLWVKECLNINENWNNK